MPTTINTRIVIRRSYWKIKNPNQVSNNQRNIYIDKVRASGAASGSSDAAHDQPVDNNH